VLYNSLGWSRQEYVRIGLPVSNVVIKDAAGAVVPFQVDPAFMSKDDSPFELFFLAKLPPLGFR
jgi:hypothetical protein